MLSCGDADLVHNLKHPGGQGGHTLGHEREEVGVSLLVRQVQLEAVLDLASHRFRSFTK